MAINEEKLNQHLETAVNDFGATLHAPLVVIGDELGLYETLADQGPLTSVELAERTNTAERYVREWLRSQAAGGYVTYEPETDRYSLTPEQAALLADENSPAFMAADFQVALSAAKIKPQLVEAFQTGKVWDGTNTKPAYSPALSAPSGRPMRRILCQTGFPPSMASNRDSKRAGASPTLGVGTG